MHLFSKTRVRTTIAIALVSIGAAFAQFNVPVNARVDAMAGARVSDISGIYRYPALMTGYLDHIQANWGSSAQSYGFIGIKSVSEMFSFGVLANQGPMAPEFTAAAGAVLENYFGAGAAGANMAAPPVAADFEPDIFIPHLLLGFDLGAVAIGADVFFETAGYSASNAAGDYSGSVSNPGARLSAKLALSSVDIMAKFGFGVPDISGAGPAASAAAAVLELDTEKGLYMEVGAEAAMPLLGADWVLGFCYTNAAYRFKQGSVANPNTYANSQVNGYLGLEFNFVETAVAALTYSLYRDAATTTLLMANPVGGEDRTVGIDYTHAISAAIENAWEKAWVFDAFQLRGGARYVFVMSGGRRTTPAVPPAVAVDNGWSQPAGHQRIVPVVGIGVSKAFATVDVSLTPGEWGGLFTGPGVAWATATVKF